MMPLRFRHFALVALLAGAACSDALSLVEHRERWNELRPANYSFEYHESCFCVGIAGVWWKVQVRNGSVVSFGLVDPADAPAVEGRELTTANFPTIDGVFDQLQTLSGRKPDRLEVEYDALWHFPATIALDESFAMADDELWVRVRALAVEQ